MTTLAIRFPLGRYHANPWDRAVNEGASEWPPSPWRVLRALVATWYTRWPDLPVPVLEALLDSLGDPPSYRTPAAVPGHTRHYLPDLVHRKGETGHTDLTLDPFLSVKPDEELFIRWDVELAEEQRQVLGKLAELLPYLGRAESVCEARLLDSDPVPDDSWWRPGAGQKRLLASARPVSRVALEGTTEDIRRRRRTIPVGAQWVNYVATPRVSAETLAPARDVNAVAAIRYAVMGDVRMKLTYGVLLADEAHRIVGRRLERAGIVDADRQAILGSKGASTDHAHAHWIVLGGTGEQRQFVMNLVVWVREGIPAEGVAAVISLPEMSGRRGSYEVRGFPPVRLLFQAAGTIEQVAPELCGPSRRWRSQTPYLPVRHRKRESLEEFLEADVATELRYRNLPAASAVRSDVGMPDRWALGFRRYRMGETMAERRPGLRVRLEFEQEVKGPLLLGQLSHFGYGTFVPENR